MVTHDSDWRAVKNALLYSDHVEWINLEYLLAKPNVTERFVGTVLGLNLDHNVPTSYEAPADYKEFHRDLYASGLRSVFTRHMDIPLDGIPLSLSNTPQMLSELKSILDAANAAIPRSASTIFPETFYTNMQPERPETSKPHWDAYAGLEQLRSALSALLLPDISSLPVATIGELRDRLSDLLNPMRAELLRMSDDLRKLVAEEMDIRTIRAEAQNIIATKVEPVVLEADKRTRDLIDQKWRKLFTGAAKAFGFAGASLIDPKLIGKAVQQTLEVGTLAFETLEEDKRPVPKHTAQFVLQARNMIQELDS